MHACSYNVLVEVTTSVSFEDFCLYMHVFKGSACVSNHSMIASLRGNNSMYVLQLLVYMEIYVFQYL